LLRTTPTACALSQRARGRNPGLVDALLAADEQRRTSLTRFQSLRAEQKAFGKQVASASGDERAALVEKAQALAAEVKAAEAEVNDAEAALARLQLEISNVVEDGLPAGGEDDYLVLEHVGRPRDFAAEGFEPLDHVELGRLLRAIDVERGAKVSGSRFYYLIGIGALLEFALVQLAIEQAVGAGLTPVIPPSLVRPRAMEGTGFLGQAADNVFYLERDDLYLVGTSEVPLAAYHMDEILDADRLPLRYAGYSPCYRREAGSHGRDTRGIFRVHWFDKVEMFVFCRPEDARDGISACSDGRRSSWASGLPYRVMCRRRRPRRVGRPAVRL
jgi:seryl-tRNA synthetase